MNTLTLFSTLLTVWNFFNYVAIQIRMNNAQLMPIHLLSPIFWYQKWKFCIDLFFHQVHTCSFTCDSYYKKVSVAILNAYIMSIFAKLPPPPLFESSPRVKHLCDLCYLGSDFYDKINHPFALLLGIMFLLSGSHISKS